MDLCEASVCSTNVVAFPLPGTSGDLQPLNHVMYLALALAMARLAFKFQIISKDVLPNIAKLKLFFGFQSLKEPKASQILNIWAVDHEGNWYGSLSPSSCSK